MRTLDWMLDSDPSIRWQVCGISLTLQLRSSKQSGRGWPRKAGVPGCWPCRATTVRWEGGALFPARSGDSAGDDASDRDEAQPWTATEPTLTLLCLFGVPPGLGRGCSGPRRRPRDHCRWEYDDEPFFEGEVEPCINGKTVTLGAYFGEDVAGIVARLLTEQLQDGGWNCEVPARARRSIPRSTSWRGSLAYERATGGSPESVAVRRRGEEYLLDRGLFRCKRTGEVVDTSWLQFSFPTRWHYDVLRGLEYFRDAGDSPDPRVEEAMHLLGSKQQPDGGWLLENTHPGAVHFMLEDGDGRPSRWNTLRALRVLHWYQQTAA